MLTSLVSSGNKRSTVTKEPFFGRRWNAVAALHKRFSSKGHHFEEVENFSPATQLSQQIIKGFERKLPVGFTDFIGRLSDDSIKFVAEQRGLQKSQAEKIALFNKSGAVIVRRMFDALDVCALQLNSM